jgi:hypothetical protein
LQVRHDVEARIELDVIVRFQNYFVDLNAGRAVAQRQTEPGLQLLDLRQKRTYSSVGNFKADLIFAMPWQRTDIHKPQECEMLEQRNLW